MKCISADFWHKLRNWEYWPGFAFYWPIYLFGIKFAWRNRSLTFFTAVNPGIAYGGIGMESKYETLKLVPSEWTPKTILVEISADMEQVKKDIAEQLEFPVIAKPDVGARGLLVKKCHSMGELLAHLETCQTRFLVQELIDFPNEAGIFCVKDAQTGVWKVTSVNLKKYLEVIGDGVSTLKQLIEQSPRARLQKERLQEVLSTKGEKVLAKGEIMQLNQIGNHARGATFINGNQLITSILEDRMAHIADRLQGFDYGRLDIKYADWNTFLAGKDFKILEVNGTCSEPAHIYDQTSMNYWGALRSIFAHWSDISSIGYKNNRLKGVDYWNTRIFLKHLHAYIRYIKKMQSIQNTL